MKVTRRTIARMLAATAALPAAGVAQSESSPQQAGDPAKIARDQFQKSAQQMSEVKIPIATEPPFHFRP